MTPQLQQAIRLLQLSTAELSLEVQEALESNMMLEAVEDEHEDGYGSSKSQDTEILPYAETPKAASEVEDVAGAAIGQDIPEELPVDSAWDDVYDASMPQAVSGDHASFEIENQRTAGESLKEHLLWQTNLASISDMDKAIAYAIADALDNDGFLRTSLDELRQSVNQDQVELDEIEAVLHWVQRLDPPGVAARSLQECLAIQLSQQGDSPWLEQARHLVEKHFDLLAERDYVRLARRMKLSREELQQVVALIQTMNPRPGAHLQDTRVEYIVPDVHVRKKSGTWQVELNAEVIPHLRVNPYYASMVRRADNSQDNTSLRTHLQEARWFIKSLQSRSQTLLRVATAIVERQRAFLEHGDVAMKPLVLHDIAEVLGMHESTISRVTTRKYLHTPRGIYELKYFFSSHLSTSAGGECSSTAIRAVIKKLIAAENSLKPLSDNKLAAVLSEQGINVARRTVAKYREAMAIPPSNERKRLV